MTDLLIAVVFLWFVTGAVSVIVDIAEEDFRAMAKHEGLYTPTELILGYTAGIVLIFVCGPYSLYIKFRDA